MFYLEDTQICDQMKKAPSLVCTLLAGFMMSTASFAQSNTLFNPDYNGDGFIGVDDILGALSFYGNIWDGPIANVVYGCTYPLFAEYDASANVDDGSCVTLAVPNFTCGNNVTYQGYDYATVLIGDQCWFAENLRSEYYENDEAIPSYLSDPEWSSTTSGAVTLYGEGSTTCDNYSPDGDACNELWSLNEYGRLYNWYAVTDPRGLCPNGWHVPSDAEWTILTDHLGGEFVAGDAMKTTYGYEDGLGLNGTNSSGFSGLPGGLRQDNGNYFYYAGNNGYWWSSTVVINNNVVWDDFDPDFAECSSGAWLRRLAYVGSDVSRYYIDPRFGISARCVRDAE